MCARYSNRRYTWLITRFTILTLFISGQSFRSPQEIRFHTSTFILVCIISLISNWMEWVRWIYIETSTAQSTKHHEAIQCDGCIWKMPKPTKNSQIESSLIRLVTCKSNRIQCCARFPTSKRSEKEWQKEKSNRGQHLRDVWIIITSDVFTEQESHRHKNVNWYYQTRFDLTAHERTARFQSNSSLDSFAHSLLLFQIRSIKAQIILHSITCAVLHQFTWNDADTIQKLLTTQ